jgi:cell division protein FtsW (lipid II flippase)
MAVTRSSASERQTRRPARTAPEPRVFELIALLLASIVASAALMLVYRAKTEPLAGLDPKLLNLNALERREQLLPLLDFAPNARERQFMATRIWEFARDGQLPNVGALARVPGRENSRLLTSSQIAQLKPRVIVRTPDAFSNAFLLWSGVWLAAFYVLHFFWRFRGFDGEQSILPSIHLLTGVGLALMVSLRDPVRDTLTFVDFSQSVVLGVLLMAALSQVDYSRLLGKLSYIPLLAAIALSVALILFGSGPGTSDAKVNLFGFQPVELIKILIAFFLAGYFASRWEFLRVLRERRPELAGITRHIEIPRLEYLLPVLLAVALTLVFFFLQKDLGPALVISCVFLALYAVARGRAVLAFSGLALILAGFLGGYFLRYPRTVFDRVSMWLSPWDNMVRGGEQVVHALWAFATGGLFGTGLALGDPEIMPAAHTDLVLAVLGEEWGFAGVLGVLLLYVLLTWIGLRIAGRAANDYSFFLALGLTMLTAFSTLLIAGGVLDLLPLSGVVTPFLSYGGTAMLANFAIFAVLLSISRQSSSDPEQWRPFRVPVLRLAQVLGIAAFGLIAKAAWVQVARADATVGAGTLTVQADGFRRYQYNPRLMALARGIPRGTVYDRRGLPLATSEWQQLEQHREAFARLGIDIARTADPQDPRHYPLGAVGVHLLGDLRSRANWGARNSSLVERDAMVRLQGYDDRARVVEVTHPATGKPSYTIRHDYRELLPLLRRRHQPDHPDVLRIMNRKRDVQTSIDANFQLRVARILESGLKRLQKQKGAAVVLDPASGDLLASVSYPWPASMPPELGPDDGIDEMLDRARYGLYPPGSTFKIVTAIAALRRNPENAAITYECKALPDGRVGNSVKGWGRPIRDDIADRTPHGRVDLRKGVVVSCNAYFAQLGTYNVGAAALKQTADLLGISTGDVKDALPQASYGQGQVVASPFQMARVAATVAASGQMPYGRWITDESNPRIEPPANILDAALARTLGEYMRGVVTNGTGRQAATSPVPIAGKTGTAELERKPSHAWFIGFAPYDAPRIAFAVLVEHGQYGGSAAAPIARDIVAAASESGLLANEPAP